MVDLKMANRKTLGAGRGPSSAVQEKVPIPRYQDQLKLFVGDALACAVKKGWLAHHDIDKARKTMKLTSDDISSEAREACSNLSTYDDTFYSRYAGFLHHMLATIADNTDYDAAPKRTVPWSYKELLAVPERAMVMLLNRAISVATIPAMFVWAERDGERFDIDGISGPLIEMGILSTVIGLTADSNGRVRLSTDVARAAGKAGASVSKTATDNAWRTAGKAVCVRLAAEQPTWGATKIARRIQAEVPAASKLELSTVKSTVEMWRRKDT